MRELTILPLIVGTLLGIIFGASSLYLILRISGKRTLAKMNAFDFVVTVALGSTLATVFLSKDIALAEGLFAFALLAGLQRIVAWLAGAFSSLAKTDQKRAAFTRLAREAQ